MKKTDFKSFYQNLTANQQEEFAKEAKTTSNYIRTHLIYARKIPQADLMNGLVRACDKFKSGITREQLLMFFYREAA